MKTQLLLLALTLGLAPLYAQTPAPAEPKSAEVINAPLKQDPALLTGKLDNGLHYIIRHTNEPAGRGSLRLYVNTGSLNEDETNSGISHFIEHMVFNGSTHFKRGELIPTMQKLGLGFGGDANAYTSLLRTVYQLDLPNLKPETIDFGMTIMRDFADGATLEDGAIDHERGIVVSELKARDSAGYRAGIEALRFICNGTRVPEFLPIGKEDIILHAPYEVIRKYYRDNYLPQRMTVIVTGDFEPREMEKLVKKHFAGIEDRGNPPRPDIGTPKETGPAECIIPNAEQATMQLSLNVVKPWQFKADTLEQRTEDLPLDLACFMLNHRFSRMARQEDSPFLSARVSKADVMESAEDFSLDVASKPDDWQKALAAAEQELRRAAQYGFSEQELNEAAAALIASRKKAIASWDSVTSDEMADELVEAIGEHQVMTDPEEDLRALNIGLARIKANPELCREALSEAYEPDRVRLSATGTIPEGTDAAALRSALTASQQTAVEAPKTEELRPFAYDKLGEAGRVVAQAEIEDLGVTKLTLSNGIKVNLKPVDYSKGTVTVVAAVGVDSGALRECKPGYAAMADAVMDQGGLEAHSAEELQRLLAGHNVGFEFSAGQQRLTFSGTAGIDDVELQCNLLAAAITHPGFRNDGEQQLRRSLDSTYQKLRTTPQGVQKMEGNRIIYGDDPRFTVPTQEQVEAVTMDDVKAAVLPALQDGPIELTLVGDFRTGDIIPVLLRTFGALPQRKAEFTPLSAAERSMSFRPWGQRSFLRYETQLDKTLVSQVRPAGNGLDRHRNRRLAVLSSIVREKLFDGLRAELGESYSPTARVSVNGDYTDAATITTTSAGVKGNRVKVNSAMDAILADIGRGQLTQDDLDCALRPFVATCEKSLRDTGFWVSTLSDLQSEPEREGLIRDLVSDARSITLDEINQLAKEIFGNEQIDYLFTVPADYKDESDTEEEQPAAPAEEAPAPEGKEQATITAPYAILISAATAAQPEWAEVAATLKKKRPTAEIISLPELSETAITAALRRTGARYAALVARPEEVGRETVNSLNRAARAVDDDPWGDCLTGIVSAADAAHAKALAEDNKSLIIKRLLGTTNVSPARFEHSCCITDWQGSPVLEQSGYTEPTTTPCPENALQVFRKQMESEKPQLLVTSSHATQFNLEMPFSKGLIFPDGERFHLLSTEEYAKGEFSAALGGALKGDMTALRQLASQKEAISADGERRVWLAAGNCLLGDAAKTPCSMVMTALTGYGCRQFAGYTVPSWYGRSGWGSLSLFMGNTDGTSLAEAVFLNNQFLLNDTQAIDPALLEVRFDDAEFLPLPVYQQMVQVGVHPTKEQLKDALGLVHDRDTFAFFGDPAWRAEADYSQRHAAFRIEWAADKRSFTITANSDASDRCAVLYPDSVARGTFTGCDAADAVFTNDFILFPKLELKAGESRTVHMK